MPVGVVGYVIGEPGAETPPRYLPPPLGPMIRVGAEWLSRQGYLTECER